MKKQASQLNGSSHDSVLKSGIINRIPDTPELRDIYSVIEKLLHWAAIIESSDDAIMGISIKGIITSWNPGAQKLYGYSTSEVLGHPVTMLMPPEQENDFPFIMQELAAERKIEHFETKRKAKDGHIIDVSITVSPIKDGSGNIIGASKIARDITERAEMQRRREEFISTTSHELKSPVTSQKLYGELLERMIVERGDEHYLPFVEKMNAQTRKLEHLISDLLELSRMQGGRLQLHISPFNLRELLEEAIGEASIMSDHAIVFENEPIEGMVEGDRERMGQVFNNLLSNAIKYSPEAERISIHSRLKDGHIEVCVRDYGIGIEPQYHERIFERFFRVDGLDEQTFPGMGIGLDFAREIVHRHGGRIWVESQKGDGSAFYVSIPRHFNVSLE